eukprot:14245955-Alexandrium_andersonii.AAC.1
MWHLQGLRSLGELTSAARSSPPPSTPSSPSTSPLAQALTDVLAASPKVPLRGARLGDDRFRPRPAACPAPGASRAPAPRAARPAAPRRIRLTRGPQSGPCLFGFGTSPSMGASCRPHHSFRRLSTASPSCRSAS